jgi:hypothetical protein
LRSRRREHLRGLVLGPPDWTTAAGLLALGETLLDEPQALEDAHDWLETLTLSTPDTGDCVWATAVAHVHRIVPGLDPEIMRRIAPWLGPEGEPGTSRRG